MDSLSAEEKLSQKKWEECANKKVCRKCGANGEGKTFASVVLWPNITEPPSTDVYVIDSDDVRDKENPLQTICTSTVRIKCKPKVH